MLLKELIKETGNSQRILAQSMGLNPGRLSLIVNEKIEPTANERKKIEQYFALPLEAVKETQDGTTQN